MWSTETSVAASEAARSHAGMGDPAAFPQTAGIVHDLGNLIQIASSAVNIVARRLPSSYSHDLDPVIAGAKTSLARAGILVRQTIGMSREQATEVEQVSVTACLAEIETLIQITWDNRIRLDVRAGPNLSPVKCDPLALQNAILNLVFNARDAMPDGGVISIYAASVLLGPDVSGIEVRVVDSGIGMTVDTIMRAFDPFFTTKSDGLGGVGLPMVELFARDAGGRVFIESEYGIGTAVILQLPAALTSTGLQSAPALR